MGILEKHYAIIHEFINDYNVTDLLSTHEFFYAYPYQGRG